MQRIPSVGPEATPEQNAAFDIISAKRGARSRAGGLFAAMVNSPELAGRVGQVGSYLRYESPLPDRIRESVIVAVAGRWGCDYERHSHAAIASGLGVSDAALEDLWQGRVPAELSPTEAACVRYALDLVDDSRTAKDLFDAVAADFDKVAQVDLHLLVGYYTMLAMFLNGMEVVRD